ncbi:MAG: hypothetical protein LBU65_09835 [Planctomycetaceae bacterium]|jgi:hypothetical protein|nr:hypothetical protein [Planctomycetaceae bacterium]
MKTFPALLLILLTLTGIESVVFAQGMHRIHTSGMPLGEVGQTRLAMGGPVRDYYQPVRLYAPNGCRTSLAIDACFQTPKFMPTQIALLVGSVYRLRITGIPFHAGEEIYPTIEIIDRTYPPKENENDFPIVIEFTVDDIETALAGKYIEKVIYLENPQKSLPIRSDAVSPLNLDVPPNADPLVIAGTLGRPVAIVRVGGRTPTNSGMVDAAFFHGCPPWIIYENNKENGELTMTHYANGHAPVVSHISNRSDHRSNYQTSRVQEGTMSVANRPHGINANNVNAPDNSFQLRNVPPRVAQKPVQGGIQ